MKYFTRQELISSVEAERRNIINIPSGKEMWSLENLVYKVLDPLREHYGKPIIVTSGYRSPELNTAIGGATYSQHVKGEAADIIAKNRADNARLFDIILHRLPFDQLIWEKGDDTNPSWIHVSYKAVGNRGEVLRYRRGRYERMGR